MGKIRDFRIVIDKCTAGENVFGPGDTVCGVVVVHLNEPTKILKLEIDICGKTSVNTNLENEHDNVACDNRDEETHDTGNVKNKKNKVKTKTEKKRQKETDNHLEEEVDESEDEDEEAYDADEWHFKDSQVLWGKRGNAKKKMPIGRNELRFEFNIPKGPLPTTFEGSMGFTRYFLEASLQPMRFEFDKKAKLAFTIASHTASIDDDKYMNGVTRSKPTSVLRCPCFPRRRKFAYSFTTDRGLYHPGDSILYSGEIRNNTKETVTGQICIYQRVVYHNEESDTIEDRLVDCKAMNYVEGMETKKWTNSSFMIPPVPPSSNSRLIDISYTIEMKLKIGDLKERTLSIPIQVSSAQVQTKSFGYSSYYCGPVPNYGKSVFGRIQLEEENTFEANSYTPMYCYYPPIGM